MVNHPADDGDPKQAAAHHESDESHQPLPDLLSFRAPALMAPIFLVVAVVLWILAIIPSGKVTFQCQSRTRTLLSDVPSPIDTKLPMSRLKTAPAFVLTVRRHSHP